ncbi:hypothetical protein GGX14DRAFT_407002 [Mycena pura]|uniref:Uncharacterized protein n=1 Tax=Mycena pura TaxID=153505 RepID=A0AAD6Y4V8_9AGAR|nr:hypothetical protein GGX14DRAFT_407002 [Mycena pura]
MWTVRSARADIVKIISAKSLPRFLDRISHFRYHLGRHRDSDDQDTDLEMSEHTMDTILDNGPLILADFESRRFQGKNLIYGRAVDLMSNDAFKNTTTAHLFFYLFYFDPAAYIIQSWYLPTHRRQAEPDTAPETVTVGYGAGGGYPIQFLLEEGKRAIPAS